MVVQQTADPVIDKLLKNDPTPWYRRPNLRLLYLFMVPSCLFIEATSGFDSALMNGVQSLKYWRVFFNNPSGAELGILTASYSLGSLTALPFVSYLADHVGRRASVVFGSVVMIVVGMWIAARLILGHGITYAIVAGATLIGELCHPRERGIMGSLFNACFSGGAVIAAGITLRTLKVQNDWSWRLPSLLQAAPSVIQLTTIYLIPESPRWLVSKGRADEALNILIKYHAEGDSTAELPRVELAQIKAALEMEDESRKRGWVELFQTPGMRRRTMITTALGLFIQLSGISLVTNYLVLILRQIGYTDPFVQLKLNLGYLAWGFVVAVSLGLFVTRFPRRRMFLLCVSCLLVVFTSWTIAQERQLRTGSTSAGIAVIVFIFLYSPAVSIGYNALTYVYIIELWPYYLWARAAGFFSTFVNPIGLKSIGWRWYIVYIMFLILTWVFIYLFFPETYNRTLEELTFCKFQCFLWDAARLTSSSV
ncbi:hypothetical protein PSPO01_15149 [Paraphaeosphaeria sporulosa]